MSKPVKNELAELVRTMVDDGVKQAMAAHVKSDSETAIASNPTEKRRAVCDAGRAMRIAAHAKKHNQSYKASAANFKPSKAITQALDAYEASGGGLLIPEVSAMELLEVLRFESVILSSGVRVLTMPNGTFRFVNPTSGAVASYVGDCSPILPSSPVLQGIDLLAKKLGALVPICDPLLDFAVDGADEWVTDDLAGALRERMDAAFIRGTGSSNEPKGLRWLAQSSNLRTRTLDTGNSTIATIRADLRWLITRVTNQLRRLPIKGTYLMSSSKFGFLAELTNAVGVHVFPTMQNESPTLNGYPVLVSDQIPDNLGVGGNESEIIFYDAARIAVGISKDIAIASSTDASYVSNGVHHHGMQDGFTLMVATAYHDIGDSRGGRSIAVLTSVDWA